MKALIKKTSSANRASRSHRRDALHVGAAATVVFTLACGAAPSKEACQLAENEGTLGHFNALSMNALSGGLVGGEPNGRFGVWHVLAEVGLSQAAYEPAIQAMIREKDGKDLLRYTIACALPNGESVVFDDGIAGLELHGSLGLAPEWISSGISVEAELEVSACLIAHVNAFGRRVRVSVRTEAIETSDEERELFSVHEGTFFGSVATQEFYACYAEQPTTEIYQVAPDRSDRVCTDGDDKCEVKALGACEDICTEYSEEFGWSHCVAPTGETFARTVNVFLKDRAYADLCSE